MIRRSLASSVILIALPAAGLADNAVPVAAGDLGEYRVTLFAHPAPVRAGPARVEWLVQDKSGRPVDSAKWSAALEPPPEPGEAWVPPCCRIDPATNAGNALAGRARGFLRGAPAVLSQSGDWTFVLSDGNGGFAALPFAVGAPAAPWFLFWPWFAAPLAAVFLFAADAWLRRRIRALPGDSGVRSPG